MLNVAISDWVVATTSDDEMVHGYVEAIAWQQGIAFVHVIASDQDEIIGHQMEVKLASVKKLPESVMETEADVMNLIDIALSVRDEQWFVELSATLRNLQSQESKTTKDKEIPGHIINRLGVDQL
ncbi:hypothetical protein A8709_16220 [Paenibacillus pectinilyticus]|uniref:IDEAL domain-containing protein n=1 Tax=Paenibacillus pectinilyticus TaxID=512399 RepID=A0A1C1A4X3_9BACL|nr:hypothetical protein [Paenibacillus pectinilyticus]OCT15611.1 hypothetical protein A8709_16220 [Paenibacillus pectinilyticus]